MKNVAYKVEVETNDIERTDAIMDTVERVANVTIELTGQLGFQPVGETVLPLMVLMGKLADLRLKINGVIESDAEGSYPDYIKDYRDTLLLISATAAKTLSDLQYALDQTE